MTSTDEDDEEPSRVKLPPRGLLLTLPRKPYGSPSYGCVHHFARLSRSYNTHMYVEPCASPNGCGRDNGQVTEEDMKAFRSMRLRKDVVIITLNTLELIRDYHPATWIASFPNLQVLQSTHHIPLKDEETAKAFGQAIAQLRNPLRLHALVVPDAYTEERPYKLEGLEGIKSSTSFHACFLENARLLEYALPIASLDKLSGELGFTLKHIRPELRQIGLVIMGETRHDKPWCSELTSTVSNVLIQFANEIIRSSEISTCGWVPRSRYCFRTPVDLDFPHPRYASNEQVIAINWYFRRLAYFQQYKLEVSDDLGRLVDQVGGGISDPLQKFTKKQNKTT